MRRPPKTWAVKMLRVVATSGVAFLTVMSTAWLLTVYVVPWIPAVLAVFAMVAAVCFYVWFWG